MELERSKFKCIIIEKTIPFRQIRDSFVDFFISCQVKSSPLSPSVFCPSCTASSGSSPEPNPQRSGKIIRRENCCWHYFWKAGYCNESRAGIHCVWGSDWKLLAFRAALEKPWESKQFCKVPPPPSSHVGGEPWEDEAEVSPTMAGAKVTAE